MPQLTFVKCDCSVFHDFFGRNLNSLFRREPPQPLQLCCLHLRPPLRRRGARGAAAPPGVAAAPPAPVRHHLHRGPRPRVEGPGSFPNFTARNNYSTLFCFKFQDYSIDIGDPPVYLWEFVLQYDFKFFGNMKDPR